MKVRLVMVVPRITRIATRYHFTRCRFRRRGMRRASLAIHPARIARDVMLLLPDGHTVFHLVDDEAARAESFVAMRRAHAHPHGHVLESQRAHAMHAGGTRD